MTFFETVSNVLTLGGTSRVRQWNEKLRAALEQNQDVVSQIGSKKNDLQQAILRLGALTRRACGFLHRSRRLLRPLVRTKRPFIQIAPSDSFTSLTAHPMEQRIDNFYTTGALALGAGTGTTAALGAWTIVSSLGAASTGTAIAGLQGAASANAITAWFGGGALKAGGLGMAGGTVVLTGVVVVPLVGISAYLTHRHANELKGREQEVRSAIKKNTAIYAEIRTAVNVVGRVTEKMEGEAFLLKRAVRTAERTLNPWALFSRLRRLIRYWFGGAYYTVNDLPAIEALNLAVARFLEAFGVKQLDLLLMRGL